MSAEELLSRLERVRQTGPDRWLASCPSHEDRSPSLSIRALPDGRTLVHCFGGCSVDEVMAAVGMSVSDLFPERVDNHLAPRAPRLPASDILQAVAIEMRIVQAAAADLAKGAALEPAEHDRLRLAIARLDAAVGVANG